MSSEWTIYTVQDIAEELADAPFGSSLKNVDYTDEGALVVQGKNIQGRSFDWSDRRYVSLDKYATLTRNHCKEGDLIFPKVGTIGKVGILTKASGVEHYVLSTNTMRLRVNAKLACTDFVYYFFVWPKTSNYINALNANSVQPVFNFTSLKKFQIALPPLDEQKRISSILCALDDRIALLRETNATLEAIVQALFKSWFVDFDPVHANAGTQAPSLPAEIQALFPSRLVEFPQGLIPEGWEVGTVEDVIDTVGGATPNTKNDEFWNPPEISWTSPKDLSGLNTPALLETDRKISKLGLAKISSGLLPVGTLLMSSRAPIGYLAIAQVPLAINQGYIAMPPGGKLPPLFMLYWCRQNMEVIKNRANGSTFMEISKKAFRPIEIVLPAKSVVDAFMETAVPLFERLVENEKQISSLSELRDTLLPRLISGQLRLPEAEAALADID